MNRPTIGVAKSPFYGRIEDDRILGPEGELIGRLVGASNARIFFVSVGHLISLEDSVRLVRVCLVDGNPAPLREAHLEAARLRRIG